MQRATRAEKLAVSFPAILSLVGLVGWSVTVFANRSARPQAQDKYGRS